MVEHSKAELIAEIERARARLGGSLAGLRRDADLGARAKNLFSRHKAAWISGAGIAGWVLSRLPARKIKTPGLPGKKEGFKLREIAETSLFIGALKFLFNLFRPFITAFARRKISDFSAKHSCPEK